MIQAEFQQDKDGLISGFVLSGHANMAPHGQDLLCAGITFMAIGVINTMTDATDFGSQVDAKTREGYASLRIKGDLTPEQRTVRQTVLNGFKKNLEMLKQQYPDQIDVKTRRL